MKYRLITFACLAFSISSFAADLSDLSYTNINGEITITDCDESASGSLEIPNVIDGFPVTKIGKNAFHLCKLLTHVSIPDSVRSLEDYAFAICYDLGSISLPNSLEYIGKYAFSRCYDLTSLEIPNSVTKIDYAAFYYCSGLTNVILSENILVIDFSTFEYCSALTEIAIPNKVEKISNQAFARSGLTEIVIPSHVTSIGPNAFAYCNRLKNAEIHANINVIDVALFRDSDDLTSVTLPNTITRIERFAFQYCRNLKNIHLPDSVSFIGRDAFSFSGLSEIVIPSTTSTIEYDAFENCGALKNVFFLGNAPIIGDNIFLNSTPVIYYIPDTTGWGTTFGNRPTQAWLPEIKMAGQHYGTLNDQYGFVVDWAPNQTIDIEACANLTADSWQVLETTTLSDQPHEFSDPTWSQNQTRYYRVRKQ